MRRSPQTTRAVWKSEKAELWQRSRRLRSRGDAAALTNEMLAKYGKEWLGWEPETLWETIRKDWGAYPNDESKNKLMAEGKKANSRGLKEKNTGTARDAFSSAANKYKQAAKRAEAGLKSEKDPEFTKALQEVHAQAIHGAVQAYLNAAHSLSSRGSYKQAVQFCNNALEVDPDNAEAKSARAEFSTATGWGVGGRRGRR